MAYETACISTCTGMGIHGVCKPQHIVIGATMGAMTGQTGDNGVTSALLSVYAKAESGDNLLGIVFSGGFFRGDRASESAFLLGMGMFGNLPLSDRFLLQPSWFAGTIILDENSGNQTS